MADKTSVYPSGPGAIVEGWRADCVCGWRTELFPNRADAQAAAAAHSTRSLDPEFRFTYSPDPQARAREERILAAAVLQIADRAPLFTVPAPLNTNPFDAAAYERSDRG